MKLKRTWFTPSLRAKALRAPVTPDATVWTRCSAQPLSELKIIFEISRHNSWDNDY